MPKKNIKYDLKRKYQRYFELGLILSIFLLIAAFRYFPDIDINELKSSEGVADIINVEDIIITNEIKLPPPPPKPEIPVESPLDEDLDDIIFEDTEIDFAEKMEKPKLIDDDKIEDITLPFYLVEKEPELIGGIAALQKNIVYPEIAVKGGIEGKVYLEIVIGLKGEIEEVKVVRGIGGGCDEAAIDAVKKSKFIPGMQRGKPVRVVMTIPIRFKLN